MSEALSELKIRGKKVEREPTSPVTTEDTHEQEESSEYENYKEQYEGYLAESAQIKWESERNFGLATLGYEGVQQLVDEFGADSVVDALKKAETNGAWKISDLVKMLEPNKEARKDLYEKLKFKATAEEFAEGDDPYEGDDQFSMKKHYYHLFGPTDLVKRKTVSCLEAARLRDLHPVLNTLSNIASTDSLLDDSKGLFFLKGSDLEALREDLKRQPEIYKLSTERYLSIDEQQKDLIEKTRQLLQEVKQRIESLNREIDEELETKKLPRREAFIQALKVLETEPQIEGLHRKVMEEITAFDKEAQQRRDTEVKPLSKLADDIAMLARQI